MKQPKLRKVFMLLSIHGLLWIQEDKYVLELEQGGGGAVTPSEMG